MGNWYFVVGLFIAGFTWHVLYYSNFFTTQKEKDIFPFIIAWAMIALWGIVVIAAVIATPVVSGIYSAKYILSRLK